MLDTCLVQFLLPDFEVNGRQHAVIRVLALRVVEQLNVLEYVLPGSIAGRICPPSDPLTLQQLKEALDGRVIASVAASAFGMFEIVGL